MRISVFGLGYVGAVTAACLTRDGFSVIGVDVNEYKVALLNEGKSTIIEPGLDELLRSAHKSQRLTTTTSAHDAVLNTDVSFISVGTPSENTGVLNMNYVFEVCKEIGQAVSEKGSEHVVVLRSTVMPGTTAKCEDILKEYAGDVPVHIAFNPEFLREGSAIADYDSPAYTIIGTESEIAEQAVREIYASVQAPIIVMETAASEMIKLTANAWHATKITFANEIGRISKSLNVDGRVVMNIITGDTKLNISPAYMRPGFAYGGSCLPKDVRALNGFTRTTNIQVPLLASLATSNQSHIDFALRRILDTGKRKVGFLGLSFKAGTDDLRESPAVELAELLIGKGYELVIFDPAVREANLIGTNREYIQRHIPHLSKLLTEDAQKVVDHAEILVITHGTKEFDDIVKKASSDTLIFDLVGKFDSLDHNGSYDGIAW